MKNNMTQEDKELLLKDLCARLPYKTKCAVYGASGTIMEDKETIFYMPWPNIITFEGYERNACYMYWQVKPYLRPMSSITDEEWEILRLLKGKLVECDENNDKKFYGIINEIHTFYYSHHIDCNGLILNGLALEAPKGMYKTE